MSADTKLYLLMLLAGIATLCYSGYRFFHRWHETRLLQDTPLARVRSAAQGYVKLSGRAVPQDGDAMRAPLSGRACVWWSFLVEERDASRRGNWVRTDGGSSDTPFLLTEADGQCLIFPQDAEIEPSDSNVWINQAEQYRPALFQSHSPWRSNLARLGIMGDRRYHESLILENAPICVIGSMRTDDGGIGNSLGDEAAALLTRWKQDQPALLRQFDKDHDGRLNADEWEAVRAAALSQAEKDRYQGKPAQPINILGKPDDSRPFVIAALSSEHLVEREGWRARGALALMLIALIDTCYAIVHLNFS